MTQNLIKADPKMRIMQKMQVNSRENHIHLFRQLREV